MLHRTFWLLVAASLCLIPVGRAENKSAPPPSALPKAAKPLPAPEADFREVPAPLGPKVAGLELTPDQKVPAGRRFVLVKATTDQPEQRVVWIVTSTVPGAQPGSTLASPSGKSILVFPSAPGELITIMAYSATADGPTSPAITHVQVDGTPPGPPPGPGPGPGPMPPPRPKPQPVQGKLHVTVILDFAKQTPALAALRASKAFRDALVKDNCVYHEYSVAQAPRDMLASLKKDSVPIPAVIIQNNMGDVEAKAAVIDADGILNLIDGLRTGG